LRHANSAVPAWLVCDRRFLWKYGLGKVRPFRLSVEADVASGYLKRAASLAELARQIEVPEAALQATVADFNRHAATGDDPAFGRGGDIYQRAPYHAVAVWPADLGMSAGIATDTNARVLDRDGRAIPGLYACGNDMASIMQGAYPGPGITLGPAIVFGWRAGKHAASWTEPTPTLSAAAVNEHGPTAQ
jgi:succinate dehydrogenase/fumarate reductase flavoprotein subunit